MTTVFKASYWGSVKAEGRLLIQKVSNLKCMLAEDGFTNKEINDIINSDNMIYK